MSTTAQPHTLPTLGDRSAGRGPEWVLESVSPGQGPLFSGRREGLKSSGRKILDREGTPKGKGRGGYKERLVSRGRGRMLGMAP